MYYYATGPIDYFAGTVSIEELKKQIIKETLDFQDSDLIFNNIIRELEIAKVNIAKYSLWEGDIIEGPFVFAIPDPDIVGMQYGFVWKQRNNGTTFIASPCAIPWIEEYRLTQKN